MNRIEPAERALVYQTLRKLLDTIPTIDNDIQRFVNACFEIDGNDLLKGNRTPFQIAYGFAAGYKMAWLERKACEIEAMIPSPQGITRMRNDQPIKNPDSVRRWVIDVSGQAPDDPMVDPIARQVIALGKAAGCKIGESWSVVLGPLESIIFAFTEVDELAL